MNVNMKKITIIVVLALIAVISLTKVSKWASDVETHEYSIQQIDEKISTVLKLSAGSAAASAALSLLPNDSMTPIAEQLAEMSGYFLLILSALYMEKYLLTLTGSLTFSLLIPIACLCFGIFVISGKKKISNLAVKLLIVALAVYTVIPASVKVSDMIYETKLETVNRTLQENNDLVEDGTSQGILNQIQDVLNSAATYVTDYLSDLLETVAVMLVTSCLIPVLVILFFVWLIKTVFNHTDITLEMVPPKHRGKKEQVSEA